MVLPTYFEEASYAPGTKPKEIEISRRIIWPFFKIDCCNLHPFHFPRLGLQICICTKTCIWTYFESFQHLKEFFLHNLKNVFKYVPFSWTFFNLLFWNFSQCYSSISCVSVISTRYTHLKKGVLPGLSYLPFVYW